MKTRKEQIIQAARTAEKETAFKPIVMQGKGVNSAFGIGFLEGAEWADKTMIDKACEWQRQHMKTLPELLNKDLTKHTLWKRDEIIDKFRQAMEE